VPDDQQVLSLPLGTTVGAALAEMRRTDFDQIPIFRDSIVVGVFSYRSLSHSLQYIRTQDDPTVLPVDEFLEDLKFVRAETDVDDVAEEFARRGAILVGTHDNLRAVVTASDLSDFLWKLSRPFVIIRDIELAARYLMHRACPDPQALAICIAAGIERNEGQSIPGRLDDLTYSELLGVLMNREHFGKTFSLTFGRQRDLVLSKLEPVRDIRNRFFHFRDELSSEDELVVMETREWLRRKVDMYG